jgi:amino acid adenylation domain-containing protein
MPLLDSADEVSLSRTGRPRGGPDPVPVLTRLANAATVDGPELVQRSRSLCRRGAVQSDTTTVITAAELAAQALGVARWLAGRGVGAEDVVAVELPRGPDLVAAMWGTWLAGAAVVVVDPTHPQARRRALAAAAGARLWLTAMPPGALEEVEPDELHHLAAPAGCTAIVWFTSGSTGTPKPVACTFDNLAHTLANWTELYGDQPHTWLTTAPQGYDVFTGDLLRAIGMSGTLVIADDPHLVLDPTALVDVLRHHRVTAWEASPLTLTAFADHLDRTGLQLPDLRLLAVATSPYPTGLHERLTELFPRTRIVTAYGLTEATVDSTSGTPTHPDATYQPIGAPLPHTGHHLLDPTGSPVPPGATGELYLTGPTLTRGHPGHPDVTALRWLPDPYGPPGGRMYRTGDLVRATADGQLHYRGRGDFQINLAGHRIDPAEVEAHLAAHPSVATCAVALVPGQRLHAYLVPVPGHEVPTQQELHAHLAGRVPSHLIPSSYTRLDALPTLPSGKVDRRSLPAPDVDPPAGAAGQPPETDTERTVAGIWAALLPPGAAIGRGTDFFVAGGHSLLATQVLSRVHAQLGVRLPLRTLFAVSTLRDLASAVDTVRWVVLGAPATGAPEMEEVEL